MKTTEGMSTIRFPLPLLVVPLGMRYPSGEGDVVEVLNAGCAFDAPTALSWHTAPPDDAGG